jgi:hypothetical protein
MERVKMTEEQKRNLEFFKMTWKMLFGDKSLSDIHKEAIRLSELPLKRTRAKG